MSKQIRRRKTDLEIFYPIVPKQMTDEETREYHLKKLHELSIPKMGELEFRVNGSVWENDELVAERPKEEQEEWIKRRMIGPAWLWQRWFVGKYFTEAQKKELGLRAAGKKPTLVSETRTGGGINK